MAKGLLINLYEPRHYAEGKHATPCPDSTVDKHDSRGSAVVERQKLSFLAKLCIAVRCINLSNHTCRENAVAGGICHESVLQDIEKTILKPVLHSTQQKN